MDKASPDPDASASGRSNTRARQHGATLLDGLAYFGIATGVVSLLITALGSAQGNRMSEEVVVLRNAARKLYNGQRYPHDMLDDMIAARVLPPTLVVNAANNTVQNAWGGAVEVYGNVSRMSTNSFQIVYRDVPQEACVSLLCSTTGWAAAGTDSEGSITGLPLKSEHAEQVCRNPLNVLWLVGS